MNPPQVWSVYTCVSYAAHRMTDRQTDRQTDKKTDRQTYKINDHIIPHMLVIIISMHMEFMALFASVARQNHQI